MSKDSESIDKQKWFATTLWSQVFAAASPDQTKGWSALESLCERYWYPLYGFARQSGKGHEDARDLVQGFFEQLLSRSYLSQADPNRGKFRSFLLGAFKHYMQNQWIKGQAQKRGGGNIHMSLEDPDLDEKFLTESKQTGNPDQCFDRMWALNLLEEVMHTLRKDWQSRGQIQEFESLKPHMLKEPNLERYGEVAVKMRVSEAALKMKIKRLREQYRSFLHQKIADTLQDPSQIQEELAYLQSCLQRA
jgi:DNA-directed RNA polymerase specialized sigma24 family protein